MNTIGAPKRILSSRAVFAAALCLLATADSVAAQSQLTDKPVRYWLAFDQTTSVPKEQRTQEYLVKFIPEEIKRWEGPIKAAGIQQDK